MIFFLSNHKTNTWFSAVVGGQPSKIDDLSISPHKYYCFLLVGRPDTLNY